MYTVDVFCPTDSIKPVLKKKQTHFAEVKRITTRNMFSLINDNIRITKEMTSQIHLSHHILDIKTCSLFPDANTYTYIQFQHLFYLHNQHQQPSINSTFITQHQLYLHSPASALPSQPASTAQHQLFFTTSISSLASTLPSPPSINSIFTAFIIAGALYLEDLRIHYDMKAYSGKGCSFQESKFVSGRNIVMIPATLL